MMPRAFELLHVTRVLPTEEEAFADGLEAGKAWDSPWRPGGPFVFLAYPGERDPEWLRFCEASAKNRDEWLRGFDAGFAMQGNV